MSLKSINRVRRGSALATAMILMFALATISLGLISLVNSTVSMAQKRNDATEAFNVADSGLDLAMIWLSQQSSPPDDSSLHPLSGFYGTNGTIVNPFGDAGWTLTVRIDSDTTNPGSTQKHYLIESQARTPSGATQIVRAYAQQASFGKYAFFAVNDGGGFWDYNNHFEGPFHSNDADGQHSMFLWKQNSTVNPAMQIFTYTGADAFSVSGDVIWWQNSIGNTVPPSSSNDYLNIAAGGQSTMTSGYLTDASGNFIFDTGGNKIPRSAQIPLPTTDFAQQYAAMGDTPPQPCNAPDPNAPATNGVMINTAGGTVSGGIYIHGDNQIQLSLDGSGNQVITVTQGTTVQAVTLNASGGTTTISTTVNGVAQGVPQVLTGLPNGMVYSDGNITSLQGTVADNTVDGGGNITHRSQMTIATDLSKDITLTGSLKYNTARNLSVPQAQDVNFNKHAGTLGLLTRNAVVQDGAGPQLEYDGSIFATGSFKAANYNNPPASANGSMLSIGGVIVHDAGIFATANNDGSLASGYQEQYHYDNRLADHPPPFFPTTNNHYDIVSWQRVTALL